MSNSKTSLNVMSFHRFKVLILIIIVFLSFAACEAETTDSSSIQNTKNSGVGTISSQSTVSSTTTTSATISTSPPTTRLQSDLVDVVSVTDGDTIKVLIGNQKKTIRFIGIDTPETRDPRKPVQCFGQEASNKMKELVENKQVILESDPSQGELDKYGRLLRFVFLPDGTNVNLKMIADGYAHEYTYNLPYRYQSEFKAAQSEADTNNRGLWSPTTCSGITDQAQATNSSGGSSNVVSTVPSNNSIGGVIKKSSTGICHGPGTTYYNQTKKFTPYNSIQECLNSGGRMPKR